MGSSRDDVFSFQGSVLAVGLSSIVEVPVDAFQNSCTFKYISGATLWVGGSTLTWGVGYPMGTGETISVDLSGSIFFAAAGSTALIGVLKCRSAGAT